MPKRCARSTASTSCAPFYGNSMATTRNPLRKSRRPKATTRRFSTGRHSTAGRRRSGTPSWSLSIRRPRVSTTWKPRSSASRLRSSRATRPTSRSPTIIPARRTSCRATRCCEKLRALARRLRARKVGHHLKYDAHIFARYGIAARGHGIRFHAGVLRAEQRRNTPRHGLACAALPRRETIHYEDVAGKGAKQLTFNQVDLETAAPYAAEDADITLQLHKRWSELGKIESLQTVYDDIEQPLVPVLLRWKKPASSSTSKCSPTEPGTARRRMAELEKEAHELAGGPFNLGSPKQLQQILFEKLELPVIRKTPKGQPSTAEDVLVELADDYDLPRVIIDYRSVSKLKSTYTDKLPLQIASGPGACTPRITRPLPQPAAVVHGPESAEHPDPHSGRPAHPAGIRRPPAMCCSPPTTRRSSCASWRTCPATRAAASLRRGPGHASATAAEVFETRSTT